MHREIRPRRSGPPLPYEGIRRSKRLYMRSHYTSRETLHTAESAQHREISAPISRMVASEPGHNHCQGSGRSGRMRWTTRNAANTSATVLASLSGPTSAKLRNGAETGIRHLSSAKTDKPIDMATRAPTIPPSIKVVTTLHIPDPVLAPGIHGCSDGLESFAAAFGGRGDIGSVDLTPAASTLDWDRCALSTVWLLSFPTFRVGKWIERRYLVSCV